MKNYKLAVLFVQYGNEQYPNAIDDLDKLLENISCEVEVFTIENKCMCFATNSIFCISGDNTATEFSAWDKGLQYLKRLEVNYDAVLFVNSSFMNSRIKGVGGTPSTVINNESIKQCIEEDKAVFPWLTTGPKYFELDNKDVSSWYRTNCFLLNKKQINMLQYIQSYDTIYLDKFINKEKSEDYFKEDAPINKQLKDFIIWRLTESWHNPINIRDNWDLFKMKVLAYYNEFGLTQRLRELNIEVITEQLKENS